MRSQVWEARVELDRAARLAYELSPEKRRELLSLHTRLQAEANKTARMDSEAAAKLARRKWRKKALGRAARARSERG